MACHPSRRWGVQLAVEDPGRGDDGVHQFSLGTINVMTSITKIRCPSPGCGTEAGLMTGMTWFRGTGSSPTVPARATAGCGPRAGMARAGGAAGNNAQGGVASPGCGPTPGQAGGRMGRHRRGSGGRGSDLTSERSPDAGGVGMPRAPGAPRSSPAGIALDLLPQKTHAPHPASAATAPGSGRRHPLIPLDERRGLAPQATHLVGRVPGGPGVDPPRIVGRACRRAPCRRADSVGHRLAMPAQLHPPSPRPL